MMIMNQKCNPLSLFLCNQNQKGMYKYTPLRNNFKTKYYVYFILFKKYIVCLFKLEYFFSLVNSMNKIVKTHFDFLFFVFLNSHRAYPGKGKKNRLIRIIFGGVTISASEQFCPPPPRP